MKKNKVQNQHNQGIEWALLSEEERNRLLNAESEPQFIDNRNTAVNELKGKELNIKPRRKG